MRNLRQLLLIGWTFARISPLTFGGGYAILPAIQREVVHIRKWLSDEEMAELLTVAGAAPGGVGVNISALTGHRLAGVRGALLAVIGITLPTFLIVLALSLAYVWLSDFPKMQASLQGMNAAIIGFIAAAAYQMAKASIIDSVTFLIMVVTVAALLIFPISPAVLIVLGMAVGGLTMLLHKHLRRKLRMRREEQPQAAAKQPEPELENPHADYFFADGI
ncbi:chromate transporter [Paenibacillus oryzisoli]|uniref:chromate transporter n=1 Tax=Paenibacillus oryzisoli TaxID=1850517 RepID=UPI003D287DD7